MQGKVWIVYGECHKLPKLKKICQSLKKKYIVSNRSIFKIFRPPGAYSNEQRL